MGMYVGLCVCLFVREHLWTAHDPIFTKFFYVWPWLGPSRAALQCVTYFRFVDDVIFARNGHVV